MSTSERECSLLGCLLSPRLYGLIVGVVSLWAMVASLSASIYLMVKYDDIKDVPDSYFNRKLNPLYHSDGSSALSKFNNRVPFVVILVRAYYRYATVDTILILIGVVIVGLFLVGIYKVNEHYLMPFIVLLVLDFLGYIVSETIARVRARSSGSVPKDHWKKNLTEIVIFMCLFGLTTHLYRIFKHKRHLKEQSSGGYRIISGDTETIGF